MERWRVEAGTFDISKLDPKATDGAPGGKKKTVAAVAKLNKRICDLQARLWAEQKQALLVILQAMDGGGKDGVVKHVFQGVNPQGVHVWQFKVPSDEERAHDFLWREHKVVPRYGELNIFNRSHYEAVLVERVKGYTPEELWRPRYGQIRAFEETLLDARTTIVKFYLHISREEQAERFRARIDEPDKRWKFRSGDLEDRKLWTEYQQAYEDALNETSTDRAPWYAIPADYKWYRNWVAANVIVEALEKMDPQYPQPEEDLSAIVIDE